MLPIQEVALLRVGTAGAIGEGRSNSTEGGNECEGRGEDQGPKCGTTLGHAVLLSRPAMRTPSAGYASAMRTSTIAKHSEGGDGSTFARVLGSEIRARRLALGLSQAVVAWPLSRAFMSSVESGRLTPSLPSLLIIARQLNASAATILRSVELQLEARDDRADTNEADVPR